MDEEVSLETQTRRIKKRHFFGAVVLLLLILLAIVWWQRVNIAERLIRDQLAETDVRASYKIEDIGFRTQRLTNVVIGDPANPDLTARLVEINLNIGFGTPQIRSIWAEGLRVNGRFADGKLYLGELDKFRDMDSKEPFAVPDMNLALRDAVVSLATPWGGVGLSLEGQGHLQRSFAGSAALRSPALTGAGCEGKSLRFDGRFSFLNQKPVIDGPIAAALVTCPAIGLRLGEPNIAGKFRSTRNFDRWLGDARFSAFDARYGVHALARPVGIISFDGGRERTNYSVKLENSDYRGEAASINRLGADATGDIRFGDRGFALSARGGAKLGNARVDAPWLGGLSTLAKNTAATPIGPVIAQLDPASARRFAGIFGKLYL